MKKINCSIHFSLRIWSILLLVLVFCLNVNAQNRKKKVTRKPVKTTVVKPVAKVNKNCAKRHQKRSSYKGLHLLC